MSKLLKIDVGSGANCREGYQCLDLQDFGNNIIFDASKDKLPYKDETVDEVYCSHMLEHLSGEQVIRFVNKEVFRVLKPGGMFWAVVPHKDHEKAYTLWHKTFFTEFTFRNLLEEVSYYNHVRGNIKKWKIVELVTNNRPHIHCKAIKLSN